MRDIASFRLPETRFFPRGVAEGKNLVEGSWKLAMSRNNHTLSVLLCRYKHFITYFNENDIVKCRLPLKHKSAQARMLYVSSASQTRQRMRAMPAVPICSLLSVAQRTHSVVCFSNKTANGRLRFTRL